MKPATFTEQDMIAGCLRNDRLWQERLYKQYFATMLRTCMRYTSDRDLAIQLLNDGMMRVYQKLHLFQATGSLEGWIRRIVFHAVADHFRREKNDIHFLDLNDYVHVKEETKSSDFLLLDDLLRMIQELPEATKQVFVRFAIDGFSHQEIADQLNISVGTSKWHVSNARSVLQTALKHRGFELPNYIAKQL